MVEGARARERSTDTQRAELKVAFGLFSSNLVSGHNPLLLERKYRVIMKKLLMVSWGNGGWGKWSGCCLLNLKE